MRAEKGRLYLPPACKKMESAFGRGASRVVRKSRLCKDANVDSESESRLSIDRDHSSKYY